MNYFAMFKKLKQLATYNFENNKAFCAVSFTFHHIIDLLYLTKIINCHWVK